MRRSCLLGLTLFLLLGLLAACGEAPDKENPHLPTSEACLNGRVAPVEGAQLLGPRREAGAAQSDVYAVSLGQCPVAYQDPDQGAIRPGDRIQVGYGGTVEETFPARLGEVTGILVEASGFDDLCALYLQVLEDLWATDPALNDGVAQQRLDLSQTRLSPAAQGRLGRALGRKPAPRGPTAASPPSRTRPLPRRSPSPPRNGEAAPAPTGSPTAPPARTHPATGTAIPWAGRRFRRKRETDRTTRSL